MEPGAIYGAVRLVTATSGTMAISPDITRKLALATPTSSRRSQAENAAAEGALIDSTGDMIARLVHVTLTVCVYVTLHRFDRSIGRKLATCQT